jgi:ribonucleotide reductase alpha subunit
MELFERNFCYDYFAVKTYLNSYLLKIKQGNSYNYETPVELFLRVAL